VLGIADSGCGLIFSGVRGWLRLSDETDVRRRFRYGDSDDRKETGEAADDACVEGPPPESMRWPVAAMPGCTLRFRLVVRPNSAPASVLSCDILLSVLDRLPCSELNAELIVSAKLSTPKLLSPIVLADGVLTDCSASPTDALDAFLPRFTGCSKSFSLRRKKVVGPECPGLESGGGLAGFLPLIVRLS
jgi:hypothetical protein